MFDKQMDRDHDGRREARGSGARGVGGVTQREDQGTDGTQHDARAQLGWSCRDPEFGIAIANSECCYLDVMEFGIRNETQYQPVLVPL